MAGNRKTFERAMQDATNLAWEGDWEEAIEAYKAALGEFPDSVDALTGLGMALSSIGETREALDAYRRASELEPGEPVLLERLGEALEQLGHREEAARVYVACGNKYQKQQGATHLASESWEIAVRLDPGSIEARVALLKHYQRRGQIGEAVRECLALASIYRDDGRIDQAIRVCEYALELSPQNSQALMRLDTLRHGSQDDAHTQRELGSATAAPRDVEVADAVTLDFQAPPRTMEPEERGSPVEVTQRRALTDLASSVFEEQDATPVASGVLTKEFIDGLVSKAIDYQTRGKAEEAIAAYEEVIAAGADRPAVHFNLGLLYKDRLRLDEATAELSKAIAFPDYRLGGHFALGECYRARGRVDEALRHFLEALKIVDLATVKREHADDLISLYEHLTDGYLVTGDQGQALEFANSLVSFLSERGWEDKVKLARQRLDALTQDGPIVSLAEALNVPGSERVLESIAMSQEYVRRGLFYTAMEECHFTLESAPHHLPIHRQLAAVSLKMGKVEEAVEKLVVVADTYRVRGASRHATAMYEHALKLAPMDTSVRAKLIDLLVTHGEVDRALRNYLILADSYYHLAQMGRAREIYQEALRLAPQGDQERDWAVRILHKIADIDMQRVDWRHAVSVYERIRDLSPKDERARLSLMELYYKLDQPNRAVQELDELLEVYADQDKEERVFAILNDLVDRWPDEIPLRARIAQAHLDAENTDDALEHLDKLGDLQLDAGRIEEAETTIRAIVALNPPDVDDYEALLERIETDERQGE